MKLTLDRDDELRNNWKHLCSTLLKHVESSLDREESVWLLLFADSFKEDGEVVMVVKGHDVDLPEDSVLQAVVDANRQVSSIVKTTELRWGNIASIDGSCSRF